MINKPEWRIYLSMTLAVLVGYVWLFFLMKFQAYNPSEDLSVCLFKRVTSVPCPSCGSTRSVEHLISGDFQGALYWNPFGILIAMIMLVMPVWLALDLVFGKPTFYRFYRKLEDVLKNKWIAVVAVIMVLANWIWNITKGL